MGDPLDYNLVCETYAKTRWALPWISDAISAQISSHGRVLDLGCGTGDYVQSVIERHPHCRFHGVDLSSGMISIAFKRCPTAEWVIANIERGLPYRNEAFHHLYTVNVMHHLTNYSQVLREIHRVLKHQGTTVIFTDSENDIRARSQTNYFPDTFEFNLKRYPKISFLKECAVDAGLIHTGENAISGQLELDDRMMALLEQKSLSELRSISTSAFQKGIERVRKDRLQGAKWRSQITMLCFRK